LWDREGSCQLLESHKNIAELNGDGLPLFGEVRDMVDLQEAQSNIVCSERSDREEVVFPTYFWLKRREDGIKLTFYIVSCKRSRLEHDSPLNTFNRVLVLLVGTDQGVG